MFLLRRRDPELVRRLEECERQRAELTAEAERMLTEITWFEQTTRAVRRDTRRLTQLMERHGIQQ